MSLEATGWGGLVMRDAGGGHEFVGMQLWAVLVIVVLILVLYPSIAKMLAAAPTPASEAAQKFGSIKAKAREVQGFAFDRSNNAMLGNQRSDRFLGVPESPNFYGNSDVSKNLQDVTLEAIGLDGGSGMGSLADLAKADMVAAEANKAPPAQKFNALRPYGI